LSGRRQTGGRAGKQQAGKDWSRTVRAYDLVELAGRNLREAGLRNSLTTLGIGVGVASLVAMLSLGVGLQKLATRQLGRSGLFDSIVVTSRQEFRGGERRAQQEANQPAAKPLDDAARKSFAGIPNVAEVYPDIRVVGEFRFAAPGKPEETHFGMTAGIPASAHGSDVFDDAEGKFFSGPNVPEAIIITDFARELLGLPPERQSDEKLTPEQANQLLGHEILLRYAEREPNEKAPAQANGESAQSSDQTNFSVIRKEQKLKIVGIVSTEPYGAMRGNRGRV